MLAVQQEEATCVFCIKKIPTTIFFYKIQSLFELVSSYKRLAKDPKTAYKDISLIKIRTNTYIKTLTSP